MGRQKGDMEGCETLMGDLQGWGNMEGRHGGMGETWKGREVGQLFCY